MCDRHIEVPYAMLCHVYMFAIFHKLNTKSIKRKTNVNSNFDDKINVTELR